MTKRVLALPSADRSTFTLVVGEWRQTFTMDSLPRWVAFYEAMRDRKGCAYASSYAVPAEKLRGLMERVKG